MKSIARLSSMLVLLVGVFALSAVSASAQVITPPNTVVTGNGPASFELAGGMAVVTCPATTLTFTTPPAGSSPSVSSPNNQVNFNPCNSIWGPATVTVTGPITITFTRFLNRERTSWEFSVTMPRIIINTPLGPIDYPPWSLRGVYTNLTTSAVISDRTYPYIAAPMPPPSAPTGGITWVLTVRPRMTIS